MTIPAQALSLLTRGEVKKAKNILLSGLGSATEQELPMFESVTREIGIAEQIWALSISDPAEYRELKKELKAYA